MRDSAFTKPESGKDGVLQRKPAFQTGGKDDAYEREADSIADAVVHGDTPVRGWSISSVGVFPGIQREEGGKPKGEAGGKPKSEEDKYKEAAKKLAEAFLETPVGKEIKKKAEELGDAFIDTLPGKILTGSAIAGSIAALAATHEELPVGIPDIPLNKIKPGLKLKITYDGPVDKPTKVVIGFSMPLGGPSSAHKAKPAMTKSEQYRAETARMAKELNQFRESLKTPKEKAEDMRAITSHMPIPGRSFPGASPSSYPYSFGAVGGLPPARRPYTPEFKLTPPTLSLGKPSLSLGVGGLTPPLLPVPYGPEFKLTGEHPQTDADQAKKKEDDGGIQRKAKSEDGGMSAPAVVSEALQSGGQSLDAGTRHYMESRFGHDFSRVRIHTGALASRSAEAVNALAYTRGEHVVFGDGSYSPNTPAGRRLLAHELTHVVQQTQPSPAVAPGSNTARRQD